MAQTPISPDEALAALQAGNQRFAAGAAVAPPLDEGVRRTLRSGQHPVAIVVTCADSRVAPEHVFNARMGELFVVRVAGPICDPETVASIEHAAGSLGAPLCVVLTHDRCAAVAAAIDGSPVSSTLSRLIERIDPAVQRARREALSGSELQAQVEVENAYETIAQFVRRSPALRELRRLNRLRLVAARYQLETGEVTWLPERPIEPQSERRSVLGQEVRSMPAHVALGLLHAGHRRFLSGTHPTADLTAERRTRLVHGQRPFAVVLACSDARVAPEHVFDAGLGELFVVRVAGNVLTDAALASIEHAVAETGASTVVVMGHDGCETAAAAVAHLDDEALSASMRELLQRFEPAVALAARENLTGDALVERAIEWNVLRVLAQARARSALLREREQDGALGLVPVVYEIDSGDLRWLEDTPLADTLARRPAPAQQADALAPAPLAETLPASAPAPAPPPPPLMPPLIPDGAADAGAALRREQLETLLIAFIVATSGVGFLLLLRHRAARRAAGEAAAVGDVEVDEIGEVDVE